MRLGKRPPGLSFHDTTCVAHDTGGDIIPSPKS
jgi:hypothetical protein